jgi:hypothetical protein
MNALATAEETFQSIDKTLCAAAVLALPLSPFEPTNGAAEKERFASTPRHDPHFTYARQNQSALQAVLRSVEELAIPIGGIGNFFQEAQRYLAARLRLRLNLGNPALWRRPLYPPPPERIVNLARRLLRSVPPTPTRQVRHFDAEDQAAAMRARLHEYGLHDWRVVTDDNISATNTDTATRTVHVRGDLRYSIEELKRNVVHEIDSHVLRSANGLGQPYRLLSLGAVPSYMLTEEGLAVINEERAHYIDYPRTRIFAGRAIASMRALEAGFHEVFTELRDYRFSHDEAWFMARRVKRGLGDTSHPGGYVKDHMYLWGRMVVEDYILNGGALEDLYVGKVAVEHLTLLNSIGLRAPALLPQSLR